MWTTKDIPSQKGKTVIVTGASTGIGFETALALVQAGADVTIASRDKDRAEQAIAEIRNRKGTGSVEVGVLDLASLHSVRLFAKAFIERHKELHLLINNAGVASPPPAKTSEGYELQFGVNFLGHFALTGLLYPLLQTTQGSRIITLSSNGYQSATIDFENLKSEKDYNPLREYRQSKLANLIFAVELDRRINEKKDSILSIAAQPGANNTELTRHLSEEEIAIGKERLGAFMEPWQGALLEGRKKLRKRFSRQITLQPTELVVTSLDEQFLRKALAVTEANLANVAFDVDGFSREMGLSRTQLHRKLSTLMEQSPNEFIRAIRLSRAASLLMQNQGNVADVAYQVGFSSPNYFTKCFRDVYGQTPTEYASGRVASVKKPYQLRFHFTCSGWAHFISYPAIAKSAHFSTKLFHGAY